MDWLEIGKAFGAPFLIAIFTLWFYFRLSSSLIEVIQSNTTAMKSATDKLCQVDDLLTVIKQNTVAMEKVAGVMSNLDRRVESLEREIRGSKVT